MKAFLRQVRLSPKKANLVAGMVRGKNVNEAISILQFTPKKGAPILAKVIQSATANAVHNFNQKRKDLIISKILVTKGATLKRSLPISRGRTHPILKRAAHITVEVMSVVKEVAKEKEIDSEKKTPKKSVKKIKKSVK